MTWSIIIAGSLIFFLNLCVHIIIWRLFNPRNHILALLLIFVVIPLGIIGMVGYAGIFNMTFVEWLSISFLYFSFASVYIMSYPAVQASSPSLLMLLIIGDSMPNGVTYEELESAFTTKGLVGLRLKDLLDSNLAVESNSYYTITRSGRLILKIFMTIRQFLGLPTGAG